MEVRRLLRSGSLVKWLIADGRKFSFLGTFCVAKIGEKKKSQSSEKNLLLNENENSVIKINTTARFARGLNYGLWQISKLVD